ncbi:MAG TPA: group 1 truncated hemoglobin [Gammaproteobacteria bacterium]|nr:group 1 truncated hemoglobin [Gammaproteobacteria bacterium]
MHTLLKNCCTVLTLTLLVFAYPSEAGEAKKSSLYERLGGIYAIASVADELVEVALADPVINANPQVKEISAHLPKAGLKYQLTSFVARACGGPQKYTGRSMKKAHAHLNISEKEWQALVIDLQGVLDKFKVPQQEQKELLTLIGSTKKDIVTAKPSGSI